MCCGQGAGQRFKANPARTAVPVVVKNFSVEPLPLVGRASKIKYGSKKDGDQVIVWQNDWLAMKDVLEKRTIDRAQARTGKTPIVTRKTVKR